MIRKSYALIFLSGIFLISFIFFNVLISTIGFIFKISIKKMYFSLSLILSTVLILYFLAKKFQINIKNIIISIVLPIVIIILSIFLNGKVYDYTWDGNSYQKATTGMLAIGWNPLYEELEDFDDNSKEQINIGDESPIYINNYAKASNIFAANVYKYTGNIETGKSINTIVIVMLFLFTFSFLLYKNKSLSFSVLFSICVITYPVVSAQFLTNYIDLLVYAFLYLTIFIFFILEEKEFVFSKRESLLVFLMILTLSINIKFSLFGYVGIYCLAYYVWYIYRLYKGELESVFFKEFTIVAILSVLIGVFVIGLSVYPKNILDHGHPFFPVMGEESVNIMTANEPKEFVGKAPIEKFLISFFSNVDDIIKTSKKTIKLKIPFTMQKEEFQHVGLPDLRLSGNGIFFSGIFLVSLIVVVIFFKDLYNKNSRYSVLFLLTLVVTLIFTVFLHEAWWARYFPQLYFFVLFAIILLNENCEISYVKIFKNIFIFILLINNFLTFQAAIRRSYENNVVCNVEFQKYESLELDKDVEVFVYSSSFNGAKFNILDKTNWDNITFINKYPEDKTNINTFFGGKIEWRYVNEEIY